MEVGIDIEEVGRFKDYEANQNFYEKTFTKKERYYCLSKKDYKQRFCAKFCAKEAVIKAYNKSINISQVEILNDDSGQPFVKINGEKDSNVKISLSHSKNYCVAIAIKNSN